MHALINDDISFQSAFTVFQSIKIMVFQKLLIVSGSRYGAVLIVVLHAVLLCVLSLRGSTVVKSEATLVFLNSVFQRSS